MMLVGVTFFGYGEDQKAAVGMEVGIKTHYSGTVYGTITKITPKGFIDVKYNHNDTVLRFNAVGVHCSGGYVDSRYPHHLVTAESGRQADHERVLAQDAATALNDIKLGFICTREVSRERMQHLLDELQQELDEARAKVNART